MMVALFAPDLNLRTWLPRTRISPAPHRLSRTIGYSTTDHWSTQECRERGGDNAVRAAAPPPWELSRFPNPESMDGGGRTCSCFLPAASS